ncbi:immunoglobulin domain-containing protein [Nodularia spumigena]|uniref:immunoglobulin domain-containing protein n=1 Tax=Nodularia spumigena TaxID=70799 RepID=UPI002B1EF2EF|nr:immunoglobulin domain-containing protein [Nodularia spumigena]MEA5557691.1 immunoglobulin domain-containing protein [Nodularia spumigena CH309]
MRSTRSRIASMALLTLVSSAAVAQPVLVTAPATIGPLDTTITSTAGGPPIPLTTALITVEGTTLTINGRHTIGSLALVRSAANQPGVLTHSPNFSFDYSGTGTDIIAGLHLTVATDAIIQGPDASLVQSRIDLSAKGFPTEAGPGAGISATQASGASHGGAGSNANISTPINPTYGSFQQPTQFGSGGGGDSASSSTTADGGPGGGALRLVVNGTLLVDGEINASGGANPTGFDNGGGSGGSLWIDAANLAGAGLILANGGNGATVSAGSGGGGRIAIFAETSTFDETSIRAYGGASVRTGGAGTIYRQLSLAQTPALIIDNGDLPFVQAITEMTGIVSVPGDLIVRNGARVGPAHQDDSLHLDVQGDSTIADDGFLHADGRGYPTETGPGTGTTASRAAGASHGGAGSASNEPVPAGPTYGDFINPITMGSGGGRDSGASSTNADGGAGGGVIRLTVDGDLILDGAITANGVAVLTGFDTGGGAGGSIWIDAQSLSGTGLVTADGGQGGTTGAGAGGGGRVAVFADSSTFDDTRLRAYGGNSFRVGAAGTVYRQLEASDAPTLVIDNGEQNFIQAITEMSGDINIPGNLLVRGNGRLGPPQSDPTLVLIVDGDIDIQPTGRIYADGRGFLSEQGPGTGASAARAAGASHGGSGSDSADLNLAGLTYGAFDAPIDMGSGGGRDNGSSSASADGGPGGGVIRITAAGTLNVDGTITANGLSNNISGFDTGGGAGGSLWIEAQQLSGTGLITANGALGGTTGAGAGGGGRIAVYTDAATFPETHIRAYGGDSFRTGAAGTVYRQLTITDAPTLVIDNGNLPFIRAITAYTGELLIPGDLLVRNNGRLGPVAADPNLAITVTGNALVESTGLITADGLGYPSATGPGAGQSGGDAGGGGHGGTGGNGLGGALGGLSYGFEFAPVDMGSGGGRDSGSSSTSADGGKGGGLIRLSVLGTLTVDGLISANGLSNNIVGFDTGGGAGGSVWIDAETLEGAGLITANGGVGGTTRAGSGAGGRIAIYTCNLNLSTSQIIASGNFGTRPGQDGTIFFGTLAIGPEDIRACFGAPVEISVVAQSGGISGQFQWQRDGIDLTDGFTPGGSVIIGSDTDTLTIGGVSNFDNGIYTCIAIGPCGQAVSNGVVLTVCQSDYNCDGLTDVLDLLDFLADYSVCDGLPGPCGTLGEADVNRDGIVDILDLLDFLQAFSNGC